MPSVEAHKDVGEKPGGNDTLLTSMSTDEILAGIEYDTESSAELNPDLEVAVKMSLEVSKESSKPAVANESPTLPNKALEGFPNLAISLEQPKEPEGNSDISDQPVEVADVDRGQEQNLVPKEALVGQYERTASTRRDKVQSVGSLPNNIQGYMSALGQRIESA